MSSPTQWTWVWVSSGSWWWTEWPGVLQSMGLQRVRHDWVTELNWTEFWHQIFWVEALHLLLKALSHWANHFYPLSSCFSSLEWEVHACQSLSHVWPFETPRTIAHQAPLFTAFSRQEYWSGLLFPTSRDLLDPGIKPESPVSPALAGRFFSTELHLGSSRMRIFGENPQVYCERSVRPCI